MSSQFEVQRAPASAPTVEKRILITGGCGFIGTSLIKRLCDLGCRNIRVLDNLSVGRTNDLAGVCDFVIRGDSMEPAGFSNEIPVELVVGDIRNYDTCICVSKNIDLIVHLAANTGVGPSVENPREDMETNVIGTFNLLEAARKNGAKRFVFASSGAPVGECEPPIHEELAPRPVSPYGASKLAGEGYCSTYYRTFGIETVALRFGNVYGPGSKHKNSVVAKFIKRALQGKICNIYGDGTQTRDFIFIDDLIEAIGLVADFCASSLGFPPIRLPWGETFQIATSKEHTVTEVAEMLASGLRRFDIPMKIRHGDARRGDVTRNYSDTEKAATILGWKSKTNLISGIEKTIQFFVEQASNAEPSISR